MGKCAVVSGHIRDQSACGSCWAFASTGAFNDRRCIATGDTALLSPLDTLTNCNFLRCLSFGCEGGQPANAWSWFKKYGVVTGGDFSDIGKGDSCAPYPFAPCGAKDEPCPDGMYATPQRVTTCTETSYATPYVSDKKKAASRYRLRSVEGIQQDMLQYGSVSVAFTVYSDFMAYLSGVYHHVTGKNMGGHAVKLIGWGTDRGEDYWLLVNSWNDEWGEAGTFRMRRGTNECGIESMVYAGTVAQDTMDIIV